MLYPQGRLLSVGAVAALLTSVLAGPAAPKQEVARDTVVDLSEPPMVVTVIDTMTTTVPCSTSTTYAKTSWEPECGCTKTTTFRWTPPTSSHGPHGHSSECPAPPSPVTVTTTATATATITAYGNGTAVTTVSTVTTTTTAISTLTAYSNATMTTTAISTLTAYSNATVTTTAVSTLTAYSNSTLTTTKTVSVTANVTSTCPSSTASALTCDKYGYLIQEAELIRVDLSTGETTTVATSVGNGDGANAMGYNPLDNYLYARQGTKIVRIHADGTTDNIADLPSAATNVFVGDVDETGFFWISNGGSDWYQVDLRPLSSTFGEFLDSGTIASPVSIADWVYFPFGGQYLYGLGAIDKGISLVRWSLDTHEFSTIAALPALPYHTFGALYGLNNGTMYASDNTLGTIWAVPIDGSDPYVASEGPPSAENDGARCVWNLDV